MSDNSTPTWLASWPLLDALSAAQHELRMPLVSMRGALQLIERFCPLDASEMHLPPLLAQVNGLFDQLDNLFELQIRMARGSAPSSERDGHLASANQLILGSGAMPNGVGTLA